jgi:hypothetical protein
MESPQVEAETENNENDRYRAANRDKVDKKMMQTQGETD